MTDPDIEKILNDGPPKDFCIKRCLRCNEVKQVVGWWCVICKECMNGG